MRSESEEYFGDRRRPGVIAGRQPLDTYRLAVKPGFSAGMSWGIGKRAGRRAALHPALEQVQVLPIVGELDVDRPADFALEQAEQAVNLLGQRRFVDQAVEGEDQVVALQVDVHPGGPPQAGAVVNRNHLVNERQFGAVLADEVECLDGLEGVGLQVDRIDLLRGIVKHLLLGDIHAQARLPRSDENRIVVAHAIDRARAQAGHHPEQPVLAADAGRPGQLVAAEGDAGEGGKKVVSDPRSNDLLDHDPHFFAEVEQAAARAILDRIGAVGRGRTSAIASSNASSRSGLLP